MRDLDIQGGFTVIEVSIFLAISALLLLVAFVGTGSTIDSMRFTDSGRSLQSYLQGQYDQILNGVNARDGQEACANSQVDTTGSQAPGRSGCYLLGKLIQFQTNSDTVTSYYVVGTEPAILPSNTTAASLIAAYNPHAVTDVAVDTFSIPWKPTISGTKRLSDGTAIDSYLLLRSPNSGEVVSYTFNANGQIHDTLTDLSTFVGSSGQAANLEKPANVCLVPSGANFSSAAMVTVGNGGGQAGITLTFDIDPAANCQGAGA